MLKSCIIIVFVYSQKKAILYFKINDYTQKIFELVGARNFGEEDHKFADDAYNNVVPERS